MIKKTCHFSIKLFCEIVAVAVVGVLLLLGLSIYKLSKDPISLNGITPYVQDSVKHLSPDINFNSDEGYLMFEDGQFKVVFRDVSLSLADASTVDVKSLKLSFSLASIIQKIPSKVEVSSANIFFRLNKSGKVGVQIGKAEAIAGSIPMSQKIANTLLNESFSALESISFSDTNFFFHNEIKNEDWKFENINIIVSRDEAGNVISQANLKLNDETVKLSTLYDANSLHTNLILDFETLNISSFSDRYESLQDINAILTGSLFVDIDDDLNIHLVELSGNIEKGSNIYLKSIYEDKIDLYGSFAGIYKEDFIKLNKLNLNIGNITTNNKIDIDLSEEKVVFSYELDANKFSISETEKYWPKFAAPGARGWVTKHLKDGYANYVNMNISGSYDKDDNTLYFKELGGYIDFSNMTVDYVVTMPGVKNAKGRANFDRTGFYIDVEEGNINDVFVQKGSKVSIPFEDSNVAIDVNLKGGAKTVMEVLNHEPLQYIDLINISTEEVSGEVEGNLKLDIPTDSDNIKVKVDANLKDISIPNLILKQNLKRANGNLKVTNDDLVLNAHGVFDKAELDINWHEYFSADSENDTVADMQGTANISFLKDLGVIDLTGVIKNDVPASCLYKSKSGKSSIEVKSDLLGTDIDLSPVPYKKAEDETASLSLLVNLKDGEFSDLDNIVLIDEGISLKGWYAGRVLYLSELKMPENKIDISGYYETEKDNVPNIDIEGIIGNAVSLKILPDNNTNNINVQVKSLGATLRSLEIWNNLYGGNFSIVGKSTMDDKEVLKGELRMTNFNVVNMDTLTTILGAMSLSGLSEALNGEGIRFDKLSSDFIWDYKKNQFIFKDGKTKGSSLGLTFNNIWDTKNNTIAMEGTVAPLQGLSETIKNIPIIGKVLTGVNQDGIFGAKYSVKGPLSKPKASVSVASSLAPGFLRDLFFSEEDLQKTIKKENQKKEDNEKKQEDIDKARGIK
ncbi:MAG: AsmA-like C-terminal domain-containing protein [Alphaproteobacteria bacterium]|jgi:hypothetical protein|nr:AsmA-like C-terminal domain-containing protein [Alphaproteobacteria bacterium]